MCWPMYRPTLVIACISEGSGRRGRRENSSITPRTPRVPVIGKAAAARMPAAGAAVRVGRTPDPPLTSADPRRLAAGEDAPREPHAAVEARPHRRVERWSAIRAPATHGRGRACLAPLDLPERGGVPTELARDGLEQPWRRLPHVPRLRQRTTDVAVEAAHEVGAFAHHGDADREQAGERPQADPEEVLEAAEEAVRDAGQQRQHDAGDDGDRGLAPSRPGRHDERRDGEEPDQGDIAAGARVDREQRECDEQRDAQPQAPRAPPPRELLTHLHEEETSTSPASRPGGVLARRDEGSSAGVPAASRGRARAQREPRRPRTSGPRAPSCRERGIWSGSPYAHPQVTRLVLHPPHPRRRRVHLEPVAGACAHPAEHDHVVADHAHFCGSRSSSSQSASASRR